MASIGVTSLMSGTAATDFGGRKATATCLGIVDGFAYLGSGMQSFFIGFLVPGEKAGESATFIGITRDWHWWPVFMIPFAIIGTLLSPSKSGTTCPPPRANTLPRWSKKRCEFGQKQGLTAPGIPLD